MNTRGLAAAAVTTTIGITLAGCAGASTPAGEDEVKDVTLTYGMWNVNQEPTFRAMADEFEKENPGVTVEIELTPVSEYWTKLQTAVAGGSAPDVFWMNHLNLPLYASNGVVAPIDEYISEAGIDVGDYPESSVALYNFEGAQYGLPQDLDTIGLWYNKTLFDAAGIEYPSADWTWDDVRAAAADLTNPADGVYGIASSVDSQTNYYNTVWQAGGFILNEDLTESGWGTPENAAGVQYWVDFIENGHSPSAAQLSETPADQLFPSGKLAMYYSGTWNVGPYTADAAIAEMVDVAPLPAGEEEAVVVGSLTSVVNADSPNKDVAEKFAAYVASERAADIRVELQDKAPAFGEKWRDWAENSPFALTELYEESLQHARRLPASMNTPVWTAVEVETITGIFSGGATVADALPELQTAVDAALADE